MSAARSDDRTLLRHLGQPFYFRHTPPLALRRGAFWLGFLVVAGTALANILLMPYPRDSTPRFLRSLLGWGSGYLTFEAGAQAIASQFLVLATVLSGILAPLYATYSLAMERVGGTIEFLKLSPMSTLSLVLGKMFAPPYLLHLFSGGLLLVASVIGFFGGYGLGDLSLTLLSIVCACVSVHAAGAFLACASTAFRGFGPVAGLLGFGLLVYALPFAAYYEAGITYLRYLSPFSTMDTLFWKEAAQLHWYSRFIDEFCGLRNAIAPVILLIHATFAAMLVWAAARWLDHPEGTALPKLGYVILLGLVVSVALGTVPNMDQTMTQGFLAQGQGIPMPGVFQRGGFLSPSYSWLFAMAIVYMGGLPICLLALLDHPHRRELVQEECCERADGRETRGPRLGGRMSHALFVGALTMSVLAAGLTCFHLSPFGTRLEPWTWVLVLGFGLWAAIFGSMVLETAWVRYRTSVGRIAMAAVMLALLGGSMLYPLIDYARKESNFWTAWNQRQWEWQMEVICAQIQKDLAAVENMPDGQLLNTVNLPSSGSTSGPNTAWGFNTYVGYFKNRPEATIGEYRVTLQQYLFNFQSQIGQGSWVRNWMAPEDLNRFMADMETPEAHAELGTALRGQPFGVLLRYYPRSLLWYPLLPLVVCSAVVWFRLRTYRVLEKEALAAMKDAPPAPVASVAVPSARTEEGGEAAGSGNGAMPAASA